MSHEIGVLPGRVIRIRFRPPYDESEPSALVARVTELMQTWDRVAIAIEIEGTGGLPRSVGKGLADQFTRLKDPRPARLAHVGLPAGQRLLAGFIESLLGGNRETKFFDTERDALLWLREKDPSV